MLFPHSGPERGRLWGFIFASHPERGGRDLAPSGTGTRPAGFLYGVRWRGSPDRAGSYRGFGRGRLGSDTMRCFERLCFLKTSPAVELMMVAGQSGVSRRSRPWLATLQDASLRPRASRPDEGPGRILGPVWGADLAAACGALPLRQRDHASAQIIIRARPLPGHSMRLSERVVAVPAHGESSELMAAAPPCDGRGDAEKSQGEHREGGGLGNRPGGEGSGPVDCDGGEELGLLGEINVGRAIVVHAVF